MVPPFQEDPVSVYYRFGKPRYAASLSARLHFRRFEIVTILVMGWLAMAWPAEAKIVYVPANVVINGDGSITLPTSGGAIQFTIQAYVHINVCYGGLFEYRADVGVTPAAGNGVVQTGGDAAELIFGDAIGSSQDFSDHLLTMAYESQGCASDLDYGYWCDDSGASGPPCTFVDGYLGLELEHQGSTYYGWARLSVTPTTQNRRFGFTVQLTGYAYETNPGQAIMAGQTSGDAVGPE